MLFQCCIRQPKIKPQRVDHADKILAGRYGISIERYNRILDLPNMTRESMRVMHGNGWNFADTSKDLLLFAEMQTFTPEVTHTSDVQ